jgi:ABC-type nitrate/sulfonate/bicarbonate transport system substrate-binding protein
LGDSGKGHLAKIWVRCRNHSGERRRAGGAGLGESERPVPDRIGYRRYHRDASGDSLNSARRDHEHSWLLLANSAGNSVRSRLKGKCAQYLTGRDASYIRLAKLLRDNGMNPNEDVKFLSIGGGEGGRLSALKASVIQGTMLFPPLDLLGKNEGLKVLAKFDVPTPGGGINATTAYVKQNRNLVLNFLKGYMDGIHYMLRRKDESLKVLYKYFQNSDTAAMSYLYDETTRRLEKDLRPNAESISFHYEMAVLDDPRAAKFSAKEFWDPSLVEEIHRSGFVEELYKR